jgi:hypothetical protein
MTFLLILLAVAVLMSADTVRRVITDGRGPQHPPVSHFQDPDFIAPTGSESCRVFVRLRRLVAAAHTRSRTE